jgi:CO/xanthine dehydrogenase Mo-binding subunit
MSPGDSGAARGEESFVAGRAVVRACGELRSGYRPAARMLECAGREEFGVATPAAARPTQQVSLKKAARREGVTVTVHEDLPPPDDATYTCAQIAEVEVDEIARCGYSPVTAHDVGTIINPVTHQGQIDGGAIMGCGRP